MGGCKVRLLVVEDEIRIAEILKGALARAGFTVDAVGWLSEWRSGGNRIPILVLTARDAVEDRVTGLDAGADDYLVKPFAITELVARTKALLRRPGGALGVTLVAGNIIFDTIGRD